ncbi:hypothetical protein Cgig2_020945 [Carnegiea gigantea]|uniref:Uncharacterized protein n=1 Tax=Carnegiea gigantea TaxID=171969 RepID=A0A9Q1JLC1_9CARY|nr:hypothetical protein Cgig2_020945 [Carnegiea gigantea]
MGEDDDTADFGREAHGGALEPHMVRVLGRSAFMIPLSLHLVISAISVVRIGATTRLLAALTRLHPLPTIARICCPTSYHHHLLLLLLLLLSLPHPSVFTRSPIGPLGALPGAPALRECESKLVCQTFPILGNVSSRKPDVAFAGFEVSIQMDVSAVKMIFGVAGVDPDRRAELIERRFSTAVLDNCVDFQLLGRADKEEGIILYPLQGSFGSGYWDKPQPLFVFSASSVRSFALDHSLPKPPPSHTLSHQSTAGRPPVME